MTFEEWWLYPPGGTLEVRSWARLGWDAGKADGEKSGTAAERKRILGLLAKAECGNGIYIHTRKLGPDPLDLEELIRAIEHPEPDAGETKS